jgi:hypothetical protein
MYIVVKGRRMKQGRNRSTNQLHNNIFEKGSSNLSPPTPTSNQCHSSQTYSTYRHITPWSAHNVDKNFACPPPHSNNAQNTYPLSTLTSSRTFSQNSSHTCLRRFHVNNVRIRSLLSRTMSSVRLGLKMSVQYSMRTREMVRRYVEKLRLRVGN